MQVGKIGLVVLALVAIGLAGWGSWHTYTTLITMGDEIVRFLTEKQTSWSRADWTYGFWDLFKSLAALILGMVLFWLAERLLGWGKDTLTGGYPTGKLAQAVKFPLTREIDRQDVSRLSKN